MNESPPPLKPPPPSATRRSHAQTGFVGGLVGAALASGLGGAFGGSIEAMKPPPMTTLMPNAAPAAVAWGLAGAATGALVGMVVGARRGRRAAFSWPSAAAFWSALVASVEASQAGNLSAVRVFALGMALLPALFGASIWVGRLLWKARWLVFAWLLLCCVGELYSQAWPQKFTPVTDRPDEPVAQMGYSPLPSPLDSVAVHYHFLTFDPAEGCWHRWDLWQLADQGGKSWQHVHCDLLSPQAGVGGDPPRIQREWRGDQARALIAALNRSGEYPNRGKYLAWPGPNSNTYPAWVLRQAGVSADMDPRAIGRDYHGRVGAGRTTTATGVQAECSLLGAKVGLEDGIELHFLCFTVGVDVLAPAIKTPLGRFGFGH
jgi:hypothetical protein